MVFFIGFELVQFGFMVGSFLCFGRTKGVADRRWVGEKAHSWAGVLHQDDSRGRLSSISFFQRRQPLPDSERSRE